MMKNTLFGVTLLAAGISHAAGFSVDTHSSRATGLGSTANAVIDDSTAIAYNPANILGVKKLDITLGDTAIIPNLKFTPTDGEQQGFKTTVVPPPHAFAVYRINESMAAGIGLYVPFGAGANWQDDFVGRTIGYESQVAAYFINPTFAYQPIEGLRLGAGVSLIRGTLSIRRKLNFLDSEGAVELGGGGWGFGYNVGAQYEAVKGLLSIGAQFRGPSKVSLDGKADFQEIPGEFEARLQDQPVTASITLPGSAGLGVSLTPMERLTIAFDANVVLWSSIDRFGIEFENPDLTSFVPKNWKDTFNFHLGAEYGVTESLFVRLGAAYDPTPSPTETLTPDLPDANRYKLAAGVGYSFAPVRVDLGYQFAFLGDTDTTAPILPGTFGGNGHAVGLTLGYTMQ